MTHNTDYTERKVHREAYITWLENCERQLRNRTEPLVRGTCAEKTSKSSIRKEILAGI